MDVKQEVLSGNAIEHQKRTEYAPASALKRIPPNPRSPGDIDSIYDLYDKKNFRFWEKEISEGRLPTSAELADLLEANSENAIPSWLNPIIVQGLRDKLRGRRAGRPPATTLQTMTLQVAIAQYEDHLARLRTREKASGPTGESALRVQSPHERAAKMVTARWLPHMDWRSFLNRVSSRK
jgi:hypothetical protein